MPTRTEIRQAAVAFYLAHSGVSTLVGARVYDSPQAPYPTNSEHPALCVFTPGDDSAPEDSTDSRWKTRVRLLVECISKREAGYTDAQLSAVADLLERTVRGATLKSDALRNLLEIDRVPSVRIERNPPGEPGESHRITTFLTFEFEISEEFLSDGTDDVDLDTLRMNLHLISDTDADGDGYMDPETNPDVIADVDLT